MHKRVGIYTEICIYRGRYKYITDIRQSYIIDIELIFLYLII